MSDALFETADVNKDGKLQLKELQACLNDAAKTYKHLEEHAQFLLNKPHMAAGGLSMSRMVKRVFLSANVQPKSAPSAVSRAVVRVKGCWERLVRTSNALDLQCFFFGLKPSTCHFHHIAEVVV